MVSPVLNADIEVDKIRGEFEAMISYAAQFMSFSTIWTTSLFGGYCCMPLPPRNALMLARLLFSIPFSNGKLERVFSQLNLIKTNKRATLSDQALQDLMTLNASRIALKNHTPNSAIPLW